MLSEWTIVVNLVFDDFTMDHALSSLARHVKVENFGKRYVLLKFYLWLLEILLI